MNRHIDNSMPIYRDWAPTAWDHKGAFLYDDPERNWLVFLSHNRDSGLLDESNWDTAISTFKQLDPDEECHITHSFGHWACGWFEIVLVRPYTRCHLAALEMQARLEDYPVLDEDNYSRREWEWVIYSWETSNLRERVEALTECAMSPFAARRDEFPHDDCGALFEHFRREC